MADQEQDAHEKMVEELAALEVTYDNEADALYVRLRSGDVATTREIDSHTLVDIDSSGRLLGIEVIHPALSAGSTGKRTWAEAAAVVSADARRIERRRAEMVERESVQRGLDDLAEGRTRPLDWVTTEDADRRWEIVEGVTGIEDGEEATDAGI